MQYKMCDFIHESIYLQLNCEEVAHSDGILTHLFKGQDIFVMGSEHESM